MAGFCVAAATTSTFMFLSRHHQGSRDHPPQEVEVGGCCTASSIFEARKVGDGILEIVSNGVNIM